MAAVQPNMPLLAPHRPGRLVLQPWSKAWKTWEEALRRFPAATLYHRARWLTLLDRAYSLEPWVATIKREDELAAACVFARSRNPLSRIRFVSLPFSDQSPPLAADGDALAQFLDRLAQSAIARRGCELRGVEASAPWRTVECFALWRLDVDRPAAEIERACHREFRRKLRRAAQAKLAVESGNDEDLVRRFFRLQLETRRRLGVPSQPLRFFKLAREIFAPSGCFRVWLVSERGRDIAGAIHLRDGDVVYRKWAGRRLGGHSAAPHLLFWTEIESLAGSASIFDLGRADVRNHGLTRSKRDTGAASIPLRYVFLPDAPGNVSSEVLSGARKAFATVWRRLPLPVVRVLGGALYGYLA
ncbi:MAG TPA: GNAT family N-acetyltransferase [Candidatus Binataceae bacterium]|nr:GNAT family N-acetyltransferase [Candidatus Binataceae bacterium]